MASMSTSQSPGLDDTAIQSNAAAGLGSMDTPATSASTPKKSISCTICRKRKLKCDRARPVCGTCARLGHPCGYPEARLKSGAKRRNIKELEARLAQVETKLLSARGKAAENSKLFEDVDIDLEFPEEIPISLTTEDFPWKNTSPDMNLADDDSMNKSLDVPLDVYDVISPEVSEQSPDQYFSQDIVPLGLQEPLPSAAIMDELHEIYFKKLYYTSPTMHRLRYLAALNLPPHLQPPVCLRYAIMACAASTSDKYSDMHDVFYQRARRYAEMDEMKGHGEAFMTVGHAQCWCLITTYEAQRMFFPRACMSSARSVRLVHMMGFHRLDLTPLDKQAVHSEATRTVKPPRDWIELEERRRTFWSAFCCDRYSSAGSGWPMLIDEKDIKTNLPSNEVAFEAGIPEVTMSLSEAMTPDGASRLSSTGAIVLMATLFGHNLVHLHRPEPNDHPEDISNGEYWKRHRKMDNILSTTFMFLPYHLRLPANIRDFNVVFLNLNIHTSTICLHQAAILTAGKHKLDPKIMKQSQMRCSMAADEIIGIMRLTSHLDVANMNAWASFCLYVAAKVLIQGSKDPETRQQSRSNLDFLIAVLLAMGRKHSITESFLFQLQTDIENSHLDMEEPFELVINAAKLPAKESLTGSSSRSFAKTGYQKVPDVTASWKMPFDRMRGTESHNNMSSFNDPSIRVRAIDNEDTTFGEELTRFNLVRSRMSGILPEIRHGLVSSNLPSRVASSNTSQQPSSSRHDHVPIYSHQSNPNTNTINATSYSYGTPQPQFHSSEVQNNHSPAIAAEFTTYTNACPNSSSTSMPSLNQESSDWASFQQYDFSSGSGIIDMSEFGPL